MIINKKDPTLIIYFIQYTNNKNTLCGVYHMEIKRIFTSFTLLFVIAIVSPSIVYAGSETGFYLGAGYGTATVKDKGTDPTDGNYDFNASDTGYKFFGGFNFGTVPAIDLAVEVSYIDFGNPKGTFGVTNRPINYELTGISTYGLIGLNFGPFGIFAKAGAISWDSDSLIGSTLSSDSGTDAAYGIGAKIQFSSIAVRAEYEIYDVSSVNNLDMFSVSAVFTF